MGQLKRNEDLPVTPWKQILTSVPVLAYTCAQVGQMLDLFQSEISFISNKNSTYFVLLLFTYVQIGHDWVFNVMASDLPKYMKEVLGFSVHEVGLYSSLPYLLMFVVSILSAFLCDSMINRNYLTITQTRKIFTAASMFYCWLSYTRVYPTSSEVMILEVPLVPF